MSRMRDLHRPRGIWTDVQAPRTAAVEWRDIDSASHACASTYVASLCYVFARTDQNNTLCFKLVCCWEDTVKAASLYERACEAGMRWPVPQSATAMPKVVGWRRMQSVRRGIGRKRKSSGT